MPTGAVQLPLRVPSTVVAHRGRTLSGRGVRQSRGHCCSCAEAAAAAQRRVLQRTARARRGSARAELATPSVRHADHEVGVLLVVPPSGRVARDPDEEGRQLGGRRVELVLAQAAVLLMGAEPLWGVEGGGRAQLGSPTAWPRRYTPATLAHCLLLLPWALLSSARSSGVTLVGERGGVGALRWTRAGVADAATAETQGGATATTTGSSALSPEPANHARCVPAPTGRALRCPLPPASQVALTATASAATATATAGRGAPSPAAAAAPAGGGVDILLAQVVVRPVIGAYIPAIAINTFLGWRACACAA
jgi:hypothetical protein